MTRTTLLSVVLLGVLGPAFADAQTLPSTVAPTVVVRGDGEVRVAPDMAVIGLGTEHTAPTPKEAQSVAAVAMSAVQERLVAAGVPKDALRTTAYDVQARVDWVNGKQVPRGYVARHAIEVRVDDLAKVGDLLELAIGAGGTSVQGVRFDLKQRAALEREALTRAVADARARADAVAAGAGAAIAGIVRIEETGLTGGGPEPVMMRMAAAPMAGDTAPPVAPGETVIRASVTLTARLK
ncbi:MAG: SIMPL domain-containing protein [Acidobacteria bacterium]|nr:SIMPL domain-containing protein [Acidobacteriota bacterium]